MRYKINGIVTIKAPLLGENDVLIDSPEFEITQGRQENSAAFIGVMYYYKQGTVDRQIFVEYPKPFPELTATQMAAVTSLISEAWGWLLAQPGHVGATQVI